MFGNHIKQMRSLMEIKRYQNKFMFKRRSVAEHSWSVTKIAQGLALWEKEKFGKEVDIERVMFYGLNHDLLEGFTGDILSTTKKASTAFEDALEEVEDIIFKENILSELPTSWQVRYAEMHQEVRKQESIEARLVKAADLIDRLLECQGEIELGNVDPYREIQKSDLLKLYEMRIESVDYFLKYALKDLGI